MEKPEVEHYPHRCLRIPRGWHTTLVHHEEDPVRRINEHDETVAIDNVPDK